MKKFLTSVLVACLAAFALIATPTMASAAGSDGPTPYTVSVDGITLPAGDVFSDGDHVNVRDDTGKSYNIHFEAKYANPNDANWQNAGTPFNHQDPRNQFYGENFLPWEALTFFDAKNKFCVTWVQIDGYNEHFGEGGQDPVGTGCATPPDLIEHGEWTGKIFTCDSKVGDTMPVTRTKTITKYKWDNGSKSYKTQTPVTVTETGTYTVTQEDVTYPTTDGRDCRAEVVPVIPTLKLAYATCTAETSTYVPAVLTIPAVQNGVWKIGDTEVSGMDFSLNRDESVTLVFTVVDGTIYRVGDAPAPGADSFWTAVKDGNKLVFTVTPNVVQDLENCNLANSGMDAPVVAFSTAAVLMLVGGAVLLLYRKRSAAAVDSE